jgi:hypothetical protein
MCFVCTYVLSLDIHMHIHVQCTYVRVRSRTYMFQTMLSASRKRMSHASVSQHSFRTHGSDPYCMHCRNVEHVRDSTSIRSYVRTYTAPHLAVALYHQYLRTCVRMCTDAYVRTHHCTACTGVASLPCCMRSSQLQMSKSSVLMMSTGGYVGTGCVHRCRCVCTYVHSNMGLSAWVRTYVRTYVFPFQNASVLNVFRSAGAVIALFARDFVSLHWHST